MMMIADDADDDKEFMNQYQLQFSSICHDYSIKFNIIPQLFQKKVGIFIPLEVLVWVMTACRVLRSRLTYF